MRHNECTKLPGISRLIIAIIFASISVSANSDQKTTKPDNIALAQNTYSHGEVQSLIEKGDQFRAAGNYEEALRSYREAETTGERSDELTFRIADTYKDMNRERDAYWEFNKVSDSGDYENRMTACEQMELIKHKQSKYLPDPYFADLYTNGGWQDIGNAAFIDMKGRVGGTIGKEKPFQYYLFGSYTKDNRSGVVGDFTQEYFDNVTIVGAGVQKKLLADYGLYFIAEAGAARDLVDFGRDRNQEDYRGGFEYYQQWNTDFNCRSVDTRHNRFIFTASGELKYYSRYDDAVLFSVDLRPGIRLLETRKSDVDAFLQLSYNTNLEETDNTYSELGAGFSWTPNRKYDFKLTARAVETYFKGGDSDTNYIVEFVHYILW